MLKLQRDLGFMDLSDDEIVHVLLHLWYQDLFRIAKINWRLRNLLCTNTAIVRALLLNQAGRNNWKGIQPHTFCKSLSNQDVLALASRMPRWPTDIDTSDLQPGLEEIDIEGQSSKCILFSPVYSGFDCGFVANYHFPVLGRMQEGGLQTAVGIPFTKPVYDVAQQSTIPVLSSIAYFEISIHHPISGFDESVNVSSCVVIGIANHRHRLGTLPGCDANSYGYHCYGDRAYLFENDEATEFGDLVFRDGDTLGLGIMYAGEGYTMSEDGPLLTAIFLTLNGRLVNKFRIHNEAFTQCTWFPCVGTDRHCPLEMNFGNKGVPFVFDIVHFEKVSKNVDGTDETNKTVCPTWLADPAALGVSDSATMLFRAPYSSAEGDYKGGLYRDRSFWQRVQAHIKGNNSRAFEDRVEEESEKEETEGNSEEGEDSIEGESTRSLIAFAQAI